ncbi:hypothetical protein [Haladaptatus sp. DYF46]|uniref:hypothetical protein n=1 Tax=Haladaptatus sp. DYF46 TaxID=2886041 RepID=UPI001E3BA07B|nr:hypothetical protein [Haladaptatus sp. DYF46]
MVSRISLRTLFLALTAIGVVVAGGPIIEGPPPSGYYISATAVDSPGNGTVHDYGSLPSRVQDLVKRAVESDERPFTSSVPATLVGDYVRYHGNLYEIWASGRNGSMESSYIDPLVYGVILTLVGWVDLVADLTVLDR